MLNVSNVTLAFGKQVLFKDVNLKFTPGNCYGLIGANGSGKSTFLKILSGEIESYNGTILKNPNERIAVLQQDQFAFDEYDVLQTVIMGHKKLYDIINEKDALYAKEDFSDEDGIRAGDLESALADMNGYDAETEASTMLNRLGIDVELHSKKMSELESTQKVRVLLAQAMFGNPDILLLDEPTNHLDLRSITWLENFLYRFKNTVIVVSHDRHFLNKVCTHIADIDFKKIQTYAGNYDFWYHASQLGMKQHKDSNKKNEDKIKELQLFVQRFSANASKSKQATSRKKLIEKLTIDEIPATSRKFPYIAFKANRECGNIILNIEGLSKTIDGEVLFKDFNLTISKGEKIAFVGQENSAKTALFKILNGEMEPDSGTYTWGQTITLSSFPKENSSYFSNDENLIDWLKGWTENTDESFVRGFLGRMLFSGEEVFKKTGVLSGGEKMRCMLSRTMLSGANVLIFDEPTNHLDLEAITALNDALIDFEEIILFTSHDHQFIDTIADRIIEFTPGGIIDKKMRFDDYMENEEVKALRDNFYHDHHELSL
ncbi:MAG: ATP-binding cassette domain-containing protein [Spirochaetes bacterium]|nr:ATP-binding cassette domain-containing protein [Spirochaetota bacterium]